MSSPQIVRIVFYRLAVAQLLALKSCKRSIRNQFGMKDRAAALWALKVWIATKGALCIVPAIYGLLLFLTNGLYRDLWVLVGYSVVLGIALFPRYREWEGWLAGDSRDLR
jgi:hypothetical protein